MSVPAFKLAAAPASLELCTTLCRSEAFTISSCMGSHVEGRRKTPEHAQHRVLNAHRNDAAITSE